MSGLAEWLELPAPAAAPRLLGCVLRHETPEGPVAVRLTEVEAYAGADDPGSHAYRGQTPRNQVMFGPAGHLYVYFTYGMHYCCNVVLGPTGVAAAVLLRAGEVVEGEALAQARRPGSSVRNLARGPANLCRALGISRELDGTPLTGPRLTLSVPEPEEATAAADGSTPTRGLTDGSKPEPSVGPRVGVRHGAERPWRFWLPGEPTVSAYRPAAKRVRRG